MNAQLAFRISAALGFLAVAFGAFGAHALEELLIKNDRMHVWQTAVLYQFIHAVMMCVIAGREPFARGPWISFLVGILFFSGSLFVLAIMNISWLGAITPIGGLAFLVGWAWLAIIGTGSSKRGPS